MGVRLYVGNLPRGVDGPGLGRMFAPHGAVVGAEVGGERRADGTRVKRCRKARLESLPIGGYGFVEMGADEGARAAIAALNRWGGWLVVRPAPLRGWELKANRRARLEMEAVRQAEFARSPEGRLEAARKAELAAERALKKLAREQELADELVAALESRFPQETFHVEELEAVGRGRTGPVVDVKFYMADKGYLIGGTVRELVDGLSGEMEDMLADAAACPFCGAEAPRHWIKLGDPWGCPCGAVAYEEGSEGGARSLVWGAEGRLCLDGTRTSLTPRHMNASRGLVSAGRSRDGRRMWFQAPDGAVGADLPPASRGRFEEVEEFGPHGQRRRPTKAAAAAKELEDQWAAPAAGPGA
jgi:hypothetical protein